MRPPRSLRSLAEPCNQHHSWQDFPSTNIIHDTSLRGRNDRRSPTTFSTISIKMNNKNYIDIAISAAIAAGHEILKIYNNPEANFSIERKADNSPLTIADKTAHNIIVEQLKNTGFPILSEEGKSIPFDTRKHWKRFWLVDPLDGTKEFIKRNGEFTVNIALIEGNKPIAGIIYVPVTQTLYYGDNTTGAWKINTSESDITLKQITENGVKLPAKVKTSNYTIIGSRSHMNDETENYVAQLEKKHRKIEMISSGSSIKIGMVAEGLADEYPRFAPTMEWDTAAGHAIAKAAGKKLWLTDFNSELIYNKENLLNPYFIVK